MVSVYKALVSWTLVLITVIYLSLAVYTLDSTLLIVDEPNKNFKYYFSLRKRKPFHCSSLLREKMSLDLGTHDGQKFLLPTLSIL